VEKTWGIAGTENYHLYCGPKVARTSPLWIEIGFVLEKGQDESGRCENPPQKKKKKKKKKKKHLAGWHSIPDAE